MSINKNTKSNSKNKSTSKTNVRKILSSFKFYEEALDTGKIISVKDGVARVNGLFGVLSGEMVQLGVSKIQGMVLSLEHNTVSVVIFGNDIDLKQGDLVLRTFVIMNIPLSVQLFGRVIDALGNTIDGGAKVKPFKKKSRY